MGDIRSIRAQIEEYTLAEIAKVGADNIDATAIYRVFHNQEVGRSTIYNWIKHVRAGRLSAHPPTQSPTATDPRPAARSAAKGHPRASMERRPGATVDVRAIRTKTGLSQFNFAARFGFSLGAVRQWEAPPGAKNIRQPEIAARVLLLIIAKRPEVVREAVAELQATEDANVAARPSAIP